MSCCNYHKVNLIFPKQLSLFLTALPQNMSIKISTKACLKKYLYQNFFCKVTLIKSISGIRGTIGGKPADGLTPLDIVKFAS
ncbi:MAG: hypothetical protein ACXVP0_18760, partial [Bacteroidia bacterium]